MRITTKGQVTIPRDVRERLGMLPNTEVEFLVDGDAARIVKSTRSRRQTRGQKAVTLLRGRAAKVSMRTDELMALTRGDA